MQKFSQLVAGESTKKEINIFTVCHLGQLIKTCVFRVVVDFCHVQAVDELFSKSNPHHSIDDDSTDSEESVYSGLDDEETDSEDESDDDSILVCFVFVECIVLNYLYSRAEFELPLNSLMPFVGCSKIYYLK